MASSRFTDFPCFIRERDVRARVSAARSALKVFSFTASAVRQTPLTETLSPSRNCPATRGVVMVIRRVPFASDTALTFPTSSISPVNIGLLVRIVDVALNPEIDSEAVQRDVLHLRGLAQLMETAAACEWDRASARQDFGSVIEKQLIDHVCRERGPVDQ